MSSREICKDAAGAQIDCDDDYDLAVLHRAIVNLVNAGSTVCAHRDCGCRKRQDRDVIRCTCWIRGGDRRIGPGGFRRPA